MHGARPDLAAAFGRPAPSRMDEVPTASPAAIEQSRAVGAGTIPSPIPVSTSTPLSRIPHLLAASSISHHRVNWFIFEGYVGQARPVETHSGRIMTLLDVAQTVARGPEGAGSKQRKRKRSSSSSNDANGSAGTAGRVVWARTWAFDEIAEAAAGELSSGDRVIVAGTFTARSKAGGWGFVLRLVVAALYRVEMCGDSFLNRWEFEGRVAGTPKAYYPAFSTHVAKFAVYQPGYVITRSNGKQGMSAVNLVNFRCLGQHHAERAVQLRKGDQVFMTGYLATMPEYRTRSGSVARSQALFPFVERVYRDEDRVWGEREERARGGEVRPVIPPELEKGLVQL